MHACELSVTYYIYMYTIKFNNAYRYIIDIIVVSSPSCFPDGCFGSQL